MVAAAKYNSYGLINDSIKENKCHIPETATTSEMVDNSHVNIWVRESYPGR